MKSSAMALFLFALCSMCYSQTCINGQWDNVSNVWFTDCSPWNIWDGRYMDGAYSDGYSTTADGDTLITLANGATHRFYWRLYYFNSILVPSSPVPDSIPLLAGVHCWSNYGSTLDQLLGSGLGYLSNEPGVERVISLSFSIDISESNSGTWWWGGKVNGVPTPWAEEEIVHIIKQRVNDACDLLAAQGAAELAGKHVDQNRIYLRGHSMGGTGTYRIGIKHPELFSAIFCHAGFADFKGPCGGFTDGFDMGMVGTEAENLQTRGLDGNQYPARDYTDMSWFIGTHKGVSWETAFGNGRKYEPPYINMRHGTADEAVNIASADRLHAVLEAGKWGYTYLRDSYGHSINNGTWSNCMLNMRKNQSYLGFSNNSTNAGEMNNYLNQIGWVPSSIVDQVNHYEIQLTGSSGHTDVTLHRLQNLVVVPSKTFHYWIGSKSGDGTAVTADANGFLTLTSINAGSKIIIEPDVLSNNENVAVFGPITLTTRPNPFNPVVKISIAGLQDAQSQRIVIFDLSGRMVADLSNSVRHGVCVWDASGHSSGVYIVKVYGLSQTFATRMSLLK